MGVQQEARNYYARSDACLESAGCGIEVERMFERHTQLKRQPVSIKTDDTHTPIVDRIRCEVIVSTVIGEGPNRRLPSHVRCYCWTTLLEDLGQAGSIATKGDFDSERLSFTSSSATNWK